MIMAMIRPETEMKDTGIEWIGNIPSSWVCCKQKYVISLINGRAFKDTEFEEDGKYRILRVGNFFSNPKWYSSNLELEDDKYCYNGDLLYAWSMSYGPYIWNGEKVIYHYHIWKAKLLNNLSKRFAYYYLIALSDSIKSDVHETTMSFITMKSMNNSYIAFPEDIFEQQAIADYLDETCSKIDEIIAEAKASIDEYKELKQSVITEAVLHGFEEKSVKHSSIEWIGDYNAEFGMTRIGRFCFVTKLAGFEYTNAMADSIVNEFGVPIVRAQNVKMFKFYSDKIGEFIPKDISFQLNRSSLNKKCLLITFIGAGIGDVCVFDEKERYHLAPNVAKIEIFDEYKCLLDEHYLMYYLGSEAGQGEIRRISKASAQPSLSMETIRSINVVLPPFDVQEQIVKYLNKKMLHMDSLIAEKESLINDLEAYKKSLIYEVVTGKRRVV